MRLALAVVVACMVAACALGGQSSAERAFVNGDASRSVLAVMDAQAIVQGMEQARVTDERVARDTNRTLPEAPPVGVTR